MIISKKYSKRLIFCKDKYTTQFTKNNVILAGGLKNLLIIKKENMPKISKYR